MTALTVASHQPDLFPYTGFWYKMAYSDVFDLAANDQFQLHGYQRRVKMRGHWAGLQLQKKRTYSVISELQVHPDAVSKLWDTVQGRYRGSRFWVERQQFVCDWLAEAAAHETLWEVNASLIRSVRDYLGLEAEIRVLPPQETAGAERVAERVALHGGNVYLSGTGAKAYMEDEDPAFASRGLHLQWSKHVPLTGDSILTPIFDWSNPLDAVLNETEQEVLA